MKTEKRKIVENLAKLIDEYQVIGLLNMHKIPGRQLQKIRDNLRGKAIIKMAKKTLIKMAVEKSKKENLKPIINKIVQEPAIMVTNMNPFALFRIVKASMTPAAAKVGDAAPNDIIIKKAATDLPAGPSISALQKIGLKTTIQNGKIHIAADKTVIKKGEKITEDMVNAFNLLKIEPMKIGLNIIVAWEKGILYEKDILDIDIDKYTKKVETCIRHAVNLSINTNYPLPETISLILQKAVNEAKALCIAANIIEKEFIDYMLLKAIQESKKLEEYLKVIK